ncbi:hypothetical protein V2O64_12175 [Verrucomicrobiaceae bacterium 227]
MSHQTQFPTAVLALTFSAILAPQQSTAQVADWFFDKAIRYHQSADDTQPATPIAWTVEIAIETENPGDATSAKITGGGTGPSGISFEYLDDEWIIERSFESKAAMDAVFPSDTDYQLSLTGGTLGTLTQEAHLGTASYPEIPYLTGTDHSASQNINPDAGFTFHWNSPGASATSVSFEVEDPVSGDEVIEYELEESPIPTSRTMAPELFDAGHVYLAYLSFLNTVEASGEGGFGITGYLEHSTNLVFDFQSLLTTHPDEIVGAWQFGDSSTEDSGLLVFQANGVYFHIEDPAPDSDGTDGIEMGTYSLNEAGEITVNVLVDTNGDIGLSHPNGVDVFTVYGDSLLLTASDESYTFDRIDYDPSSAIIGAWRLCDNDEARTAVIVFLGNGYYYHGQVNQGDPSGEDGMERGTYSWNEATGILTATPITDTNLELGLSHPLTGYDEVTVTGQVSLRIFDGEPFYLHRISNAAILPDWRITKARNFNQTAADTPPANEIFWDLYASLDTRNAGDTASVTLTGGIPASPRPFDDEGEGEWSFEVEFADQAGLDAAFPDDQEYTFTLQGGALGTRIQTINIGSEDYPPAPYLTGTNLADAQTIDPSIDFTFTWNSPADSSTNLVLTSEPNEDGTEFFDELDSSGTSTGVTIPAGTLDPATTGYGYLEFSRSSSNVSGENGFGVSGFSGRQSITLDFTFATNGGNDGGLGDAAAEAGLTGDDALPNATPFGDGIDNLLKFAFNMNLSGYDNGKLAPGGNSGLPAFSLKSEEGISTFELEFVRRVGSSLTYSAQRSDSLGDFVEMQGAVTITAIPGGEFERVTVSEPCDPAIIPRCFGRVLVTAP